MAADTDSAEALKVLARAYKDLIWRRQGQVNDLRSALRDVNDYGHRAGSGEASDTTTDHKADRRLSLAEHWPAAMRTPGHGQSLITRSSCFGDSTIAFRFVICQRSIAARFACADSQPVLLSWRLSQE